MVGSWHWINHRIVIRCSRGAVRCIVLRYRRRESRCIIASRCVALCSTVVITRWLVRGTGSTTGLPSGAPGRGALHCIALSPRESRCIIAARSVALWSTVVITRWLVRGTGSTTGLPSGARRPRRVALYRAIAARIALHYRIAERGVTEPPRGAGLRALKR